MAKKTRKAKPNDTRYVWSPMHGGCIMQQLFAYVDIPGFRGYDWRDENSMDEGQYPVDNEKARGAVEWYTLEEKIQTQKRKAEELRSQLAMLDQKIHTLRVKQLDAAKRINRG